MVKKFYRLGHHSQYFNRWLETKPNLTHFTDLELTVL